MAHKHDWRAIMETGRPFLLLALAYLIKRSPATPGTTAFQLLESAIEQLRPTTPESALIRKIRKTHRQLRQTDPQDTARRAVLQKSLLRHLDQL